MQMQGPILACSIWTGQSGMIGFNLHDQYCYYCHEFYFMIINVVIIT